MASQSIGAKVKKAVFTVPVDFDSRSKRELEIGARMAGLEIVGLVPEPVAAAMGCGFDGSGEAFVAVYDFGGGTCDASVVEVSQNRFIVRGSAGDRWLGGDDFDEVMARHVADEFLRASGVNLHNRAESWQRLIFACEEAKRWLSTLSSVDVVLPEAAQGPTGAQTLLVPMTRASFEEISADIITSSIEVARAAAAKSKVQPKKIDALLVTGGSSRIPAVREAVEKYFGRRALTGIHPEHAVVIGAAVRAAVLSNQKVPEDFVDRLRGLGTVGRDIGLALAGGTTEHIIQASTRPPVAAHRIYSTSRDNQPTIRLELVEGPSTLTAENRRIGGFVVEGLPLRPAGALSLDVYFELSTTGTLYVTAQERSTGQRAQGTFDLHIMA
jgi:molecular chaperone DnaK